MLNTRARAEALEREIFERRLVIIYERKIEDSYSVKDEILLRPRKKKENYNVAGQIICETGRDLRSPFPVPRKEGRRSRS